MMIRIFSRILIAVLICGQASQVLAQASPSVLYVPLIGISSVPEPLALPLGVNEVTYHYAVKNFLKEVALTDVQVFDDTCDSIIFVEGDDNNDSKLDYSETWRYVCTTRLTLTTHSTATAQGQANEIVASHKAYATVVVGSSVPPPLVSIVNVTKVAYPLSLPVGGGEITFTYKVTNPGVAPLSEVVVLDDKCAAMSGKLGDTNGNNLLDTSEVWIYTCTTRLVQTTTNTVKVKASANGLEAVGEATIIVKVEIPTVETSPGFPDTGQNNQLKIVIGLTLVGMLIVVIMTLSLMSKSKPKKKLGKRKDVRKSNRL